MRAILVIALLAVVALIAALALGIVDVNQTRDGALPKIEAKGGQLPTFDVDTADVEVTTKNTTIEVPKIETEKQTVEVPSLEVEK